MKTAVYSRDTLLSFAPITPQLGHIYLSSLVLPTGVPRNHFLALVTQVLHHFGHKAWVSKSDLVSTYMYIRDAEGFADLV